MSILTNRGLLLARIEQTFRSDEITGDEAAAASDSAFLVEAPDFTPDITQLQRANLKDSLSPDPAVPGRKIGTITFQHEVRSNAVSPPVDGTPPLLGRLLQACAMQRTFRDGQTTAGDSFGALRDITPGGANTTWTLTPNAPYTGARRRIVQVEITDDTGGSEEATVTVLGEGNLAEEVQTGVSFTDTDTVTLLSDAEFTVTTPAGWTVGDKFEFFLLPDGHEYRPMSDLDTMPSLTIYLYFDGLLHKMTGARGTWSLESPAGQYAKFTFTFTGDYVDPVDASIPSNPGFETTKPRPVELAQMALTDALGSFTAIKAQQWTLDIANSVNIDESVNAQEAYEGAVITSRAPTGNVNPDAVQEATFAFWQRLREGASLFFHALVGQNKGNVVRFEAPSAQFSNLGYQDRNGIRVYSADMQLARVDGDDEIVVAFN